MALHAATNPIDGDRSAGGVRLHVAVDIVDLHPAGHIVDPQQSQLARHGDLKICQHAIPRAGVQLQSHHRADRNKRTQAAHRSKETRGLFGAACANALLQLHLQCAVVTALHHYIAAGEQLQSPDLLRQPPRLCMRRASPILALALHGLALRYGHRTCDRRRPSPLLNRDLHAALKQLRRSLHQFQCALAALPHVRILFLTIHQFLEHADHAAIHHLRLLLILLRQALYQ